MVLGGIGMKLVIAIINNDDCPSVLNEITRKGYSATKLSTSGGFLRAGNATLLIGVEDGKLDEVFGILERFSSKRTELVQATPSYVDEVFISMPVKVTVGGAIVFVLDVEQFRKF